MIAWDLLVDRTDLASTELVEAALPSVGEGQALLGTARVGLTTNNLTYATLGVTLHYWDFFPTAVPGRAHVPLWGYAEVAASRCEGLAAGDLVFGYLPSASHLLVTPSPVTRGRFTDTAAHRAGLMPIYNEYAVVPETDDLDALYRPLFLTSFAFEQWAADQDWFGASRLLISSASSRTGYGVAHLAHTREAGVDVVGLTSTPNVAFTEALGCYDRVVAYEDVETLPVVPTLYADVAGVPALRARIHDLLGEDLRHDAILGASHVAEPTALGVGAGLPGPTPTLFAAFDTLRTPAMRQQVAERYPAAWASFRALLDQHVRLVVQSGPAALQAAWTRLQAGDVDPAEGTIIAFPP